jgi:cAMP-dependent protein kinase regulator
VSVSAEVDQDPRVKFDPPVIDKSDAAVERITKAVSSSFLFSALNKDQMKAVVGAMAEKKVQAGEVIIEQGADGDFFYVIDSGDYEVWKKIGAADPQKVFAYEGKGSFGELALMYNCPRAATVKASTEGVLWALDRQTFRHIVINATAEQRKRYEEFLEKIPMLGDLTSQQRSLIADCLEQLTYTDGEVLIKQGEPGDKFYLIEKGEAVATQEVDGKEVEVGRMKEGDYFGERALVLDEPRAANVKAVGEINVAAMDRAAFERLLGNHREDMLHRIGSYQTAKQILESQSTENVNGDDTKSDNDDTDNNNSNDDIAAAAAAAEPADNNNGDDDSGNDNEPAPVAAQDAGDEN